MIQLTCRDHYTTAGCIRSCKFCVIYAELAQICPEAPPRLESALVLSIAKGCKFPCCKHQMYTATNGNRAVKPDAELYEPRGGVGEVTGGLRVWVNMSQLKGENVSVEIFPLFDNY